MPKPVPDAADDFCDLDFRDSRLSKRLQTIVAALQERPTHGFPEAMGSDAGTEAFYRFIDNPKVSAEKLLSGHFANTRRRAEGLSRVLAIHDTTLCQFNGESAREGLYPTTRGRSGWLAHVCMGVAGDGTRRPLGLLGMIPVTRGEENAGGTARIYANEADRWTDLVRLVEAEKTPGTELVHVMDREADSWALFDLLTSLNALFVIRLVQDRRLCPEPEPLLLSDHLPSAVLHLTRTVRLSMRPGGDRPPANMRKNPPRDEREATLEIRALRTQFARPDKRKSGPLILPIHVIHVVEINVPKGQHPVSWELATSLPIDTPEQVAAIVDAYRARWLIEEYFKALKTGCSYEDRQLETFETLHVAFALLVPIAWRLLALRWAGRNDPDRPASELFSSSQIELLCKLDNERRERLPAKPTLNQAMFAIARLGGFLQRNRVPGWQVIGRGLIRFLQLHEGYEMGLAAAKRAATEALEM